MPFIHYVQNPPQFTCPGCAWALTPANSDMLAGAAPLKCSRCGWEHPAENLQAVSGHAVNAEPGARLELGEGVFVEVPAAPIAASDAEHNASAIGSASIGTEVVRGGGE